MNNLKEFLQHLDSQKEVALAVAKDEKELDLFKVALNTNGFKEVHTFPEILNDISRKAKIFYSIEDEFPKSLYDLMVQYSTGQVEIFDFVGMKSTVANPDYSKIPLVLIVTKENLSHFEKKGYQILKNVGMTYQS